MAVVVPHEIAIMQYDEMQYENALKMDQPRENCSPSKREIHQPWYSWTGQSRHDEFLPSFLSCVEFQTTNRFFLFFIA